MDSTDQPWCPRLSLKQLEVFNDYHRFLLVSGPRKSGKTIAVLHRIVRHLWETPNARVAIFAKTIKNAKLGVWDDLCGTGPNSVMTEWLAAGLTAENGVEFGYTVEPKVDGATRMHYFRVRNQYGGESELMLHSLDYDGDVENAVMSTRFSMIYFSELQLFKDPKIFKITTQQLRMVGLDYAAHQWLADTNPPEEGQDHFAYKLFYEPFLPEEKDEEPAPVDPEREEYLAMFNAIEIGIEDNPFLDPREKRDLINTYKDDPEGHDRFIKGVWTPSGGHADKHFSKLFTVNLHVRGDVSSRNEDEWTYLNPLPNCSELVSGWDIGDVNHAAAILQPRMKANGKLAFDVLDEVVSIGVEMSVEEFTVLFIERMEAIEKVIGHPVSWRHWSDSSSFRYRSGISATEDLMESLTVERVSEGRILLQSAAASKKPGAVKKRVAVVKQLLREQRLLVSAHCVDTIAMLKNLPKGKKVGEYIPRGHKLKHPFDALTYPIYMEMLDELEMGGDDKGATGTRYSTVSLGHG